VNNKKIFILGYGNPGRQDDGLGPAVAEAIEGLNIPGVTVDSDYQLNIEDAASLSGQDIVLYVDASKSASEPYEIRKIAPASEITFTSHTVSPESVLAICDDHFGPAPEAWVLEIRGYEFEMIEGLSRKARKNFQQAFAFITQLIKEWKE